MTETFRTAGGLPLEDFFEHRPIEDENLVPAVDPRRDNTTTQLRTALHALRTPKDGFVYEGVVINVYPSNTAAYVKRGQALNMKAITRNLMNPQSNFKLPIDTEPSINVYKVFMRGDAKPFPCGPNDPIIYTYPEILAHESLRDKEPFSVGTIVELDDKKQSTIVNFYPGAVPIQWKDKSNKRSLFKNKTPVTVDAVVDRPATGTRAARREASRAAARAAALAAKSGIRKQIFEENNYTLKLRHNHTGVRSNAILNKTHQVALKAKHQSKIKSVTREMGMQVKTLEKIFLKEGGTFDPYAINNNTNATGLIQWMPSTARAFGITTDELLKKGPDFQLDQVLKYFKKNKAQRPSSNWEEVDWYFIVFYPSAIGKKDDYVIGYTGKTNAERAERATYTASVNKGYIDPHHPRGWITRRSVRAAWMG